ncbi:MAG: hypothetical protein KVP17_004897 [Porospora cf. gigantea B]|uniref:uncharacterized protein n=2 Tax=Porospora cf. gigantea B TaxID=2853592 RepID=UPI003571A2DA|nr:MAG: hypothetical protein KVP17_004897 [Porospora cf. gigantea B]
MINLFAPSRPSTLLKQADEASKEAPQTGLFDPSALERGAKALREMDNSPNASKAFEVIRLQQVTRQAESDAEAAKYRLQAEQAKIDRSRVDGEEKRKLVQFQQQHERETAKTKLQLERDAHAQRMHDERQEREANAAQELERVADRERVKSQHEQERLLMREESLKREKAASRVDLEARARIEAAEETSRERVNKDIRMEQLLAKTKAITEGQRERLQLVIESVRSGLGRLFTDRNTGRRFLQGSLLLTTGLFASKYSTQAGIRQLESKLSKPSLVRETSRWTVGRRLFARPAGSDMLVLPAELKKRLDWSVRSVCAAKKAGAPLRHMLIHGPPGTGKTLFARNLAKSSGMDYAIMSGGDIGPLGKSAVTELNKLLRWARASSKGSIVFIDEAESFLRQGRGETSSMSEDSRNALSAFLHQTGTEDDNVCIILASNHPEVLDKAVLDRIDERFEFPMPGLEERHAMLEMYFNKYIASQPAVAVDPRIDSDYWLDVARRLDQMSGRQIVKLIVSMQSAMFGSGSAVLSQELAELVINWKLQAPAST